jgi:hypothetical protein
MSAEPAGSMPASPAKQEKHPQIYGCKTTTLLKEFTTAKGIAATV